MRRRQGWHAESTDHAGRVFPARGKSAANEGKHGRDPNKPVCRIGVLGGSGASAILPAVAEGADVLLTAEVKHSDAIDANPLGLGLVVAGHYETEHVVLEPLIRRLQNECFIVQYQLSRADASPFVRLEEDMP
jgi:putative NIF3 family GTP cyclohydrolase 1 type 2